MASPQPVPSSKASDRDLASMAEARTLARRARQAQVEIAELSQERIDAIVDAMAAAVAPQCEALAKLAVEETGYGVVADKIQKNQFSADRVYRFIRPMRTVGVLQRLEDRKVVEIAEPFGVVAAIVPSTNPTSTAIYKILIALKARCAIVISPHPSAVRCITRVAEIMNEAARGAGAPEGSINWMTTVTLEGTQELMKSRDVAVILATGGMGLVRAAYSSGKPAYGVGPGNAPCYVEGSADIRKAASDIIIGKTFDNGLLCSSPNSVVVDTAIAEELKREFVQQGAYFLNAAEIDAVTKVLVSPQRLPNPALVGRPATVIAEKAGISVPPSTRVLVAPLAGVGRDYPLSIEKLCPAVVVVRRTGLARGLRTLQGNSALRWHGSHDVDPFPQRSNHSGVRTQEARIPHCRQHADDAWVCWDDHRPGSRDDAGVRRMGRQHHLRQHLAEALAERQASGVRDPARQGQHCVGRQGDVHSAPGEARGPAAKRRAGPLRSRTTDRPVPGRHGELRPRV